MSKIYGTIAPRIRMPKNAPQMVKDREDQVQNSAGGFVFDAGDNTILDRFLILGTDGPTYYASAQKLTRDAAKRLDKIIEKDGVNVVNRVVEISASGRAPKNDPALFVLALCASAKSEATRAAAFAALPKVARIPTHLFDFWTYTQQFRGSGRALRRAIADWYINNKNLAYHAVKYQSRNGVSNRDMLRLARPNPNTLDIETRRTLEWIVKGDNAPTQDDPLVHFVPRMIQGYQMIQNADTAVNAARIIEEYKLPREAVPTQFLNDKVVWEVLLETDMPLTAMIRNLAKMTSIGLIGPLSNATKKVVETLKNREALKKARIHPITLLSALRTYKMGHGIKGSLTWEPNPQVMAALEMAFYDSFDFVEPSNKSIMLAFDVSGSMTGGTIAGVPGLTPLEAEACMGLVFAKTELNYVAMAFDTNFRQIPLTPMDNLDSAVSKFYNGRFGGTDCALPMRYALEKKLAVDAFIIFTDNETWAGSIKPHAALQQYRHKMGIPAKMIVVGLTATGFSIADPNDRGMLDIVGFDSAAPNVIANFITA